MQKKKKQMKRTLLKYILIRRCCNPLQQFHHTLSLNLVRPKTDKNNFAVSFKTLGDKLRTLSFNTSLI